MVACTMHTKTQKHPLGKPQGTEGVAESGYMKSSESQVFKGLGCSAKQFGLFTSSGH